MCMYEPKQTSQNKYKSPHREPEELLTWKLSVGLKQTKSMCTNSIQRQVFKSCAGVEKEK